MAKTAGTNSLVDRIAGDIRGGRFSPGSWLKQIDLQERYACNRSEVRRALERLARQRLIQYVPNRGYYVHLEDDDGVAEIRDIRIMLEAAAAERMVEGATAERLAILRSLAEDFDQLVGSGTIFEIYEANLQFHRALLETTGNRSLVELVGELRLRTSPAPASQWSTRRRIEQSSAEHFEMVEALSAGDAERLRRVIARHIRQSSEPAAGVVPEAARQADGAQRAG